MTSDLLLTTVSRIGFLGLVALVSWRQTRGRMDTAAGYFLAGRGLGATFIAGSLLFTNLPAEQLIGLSVSGLGMRVSALTD